MHERSIHALMSVWLRRLCTQTGTNAAELFPAVYALVRPGNVSDRKQQMYIRRDAKQVMKKSEEFNLEKVRSGVYARVDVYALAVHAAMHTCFACALACVCFSMCVCVCAYKA